MRVVISGIGDHLGTGGQPVSAGTRLMLVDDPAKGVKNRCFLIDLSKVPGDLVDPAIVQVQWGLLGRNGEQRPGGTITRRDGGRQVFFDATILKPYLDAWHARAAELAAAAPVEAHRAEP
jgi:hypothetical protein